MQPLKRKSQATDAEAESTEQNLGLGHSGNVNNSLKTPVSGKSGKVQKAPRVTKTSRAASQTPATNVGEGDCWEPLGFSVYISYYVCQKVVVSCE